MKQEVNKYLIGDFEPLRKEIDASDLKVTGSIPLELRGTYMRNGPNPYFEPLSYLFPIDGDGMIHAVYFDQGKVSYKNRYIMTDGLQAEMRAGRALYPGITRPDLLDLDLLKKYNAPENKNGAFIQVVPHAGMLLACLEGGGAKPYKMSYELETLGIYDCDGRINGMNAHTHLDAKTGELFFVVAPDDKQIFIHALDKNGKLSFNFVLPCDHNYMVHDFVLTQKYIVFVLGPAFFTAKGLEFDNKMGSKIAVVERKSPHNISWFDYETCFVYHYFNAYDDDNGDIVIDYVHRKDCDTDEDGPWHITLSIATLEEYINV